MRKIRNINILNTKTILFLLITCLVFTLISISVVLGATFTKSIQNQNIQTIYADNAQTITFTQMPVSSISILTNKTYQNITFKATIEKTMIKVSFPNNSNVLGIITISQNKIANKDIKNSILTLNLLKIDFKSNNTVQILTLTKTTTAWKPLKYKLSSLNQTHYKVEINNTFWKKNILIGDNTKSDTLTTTKATKNKKATTNTTTIAKPKVTITSNITNSTKPKTTVTKPAPITTTSQGENTVLNLIILSIIFILLVAIFLFIRYRKKAQEQQIPPQPQVNQIIKN